MYFIAVYWTYFLVDSVNKAILILIKDKKIKETLSILGAQEVNVLSKSSYTSVRSALLSPPLSCQV